MGLNLAEVPESIRELVGWLERRGFAEADEWHGPMSSQWMEFLGSGCVIRVSSDRGRWDILLSFAGIGERFTTDVYWVYLDDVSPMDIGLDLDAQVHFVIERFDELVGRLQNDTEAAPTLIAIGRRVVKVLLDLPPEFDLG